MVMPQIDRSAKGPTIVQLGVGKVAAADRLLSFHPSINPQTFVPQAGGIGCSLGFIWSLIEHGIPLQEKEKTRRKHGWLEERLRF
jgi:hypothetical protein